jgi:putative restriction endonuclease
MSYCVFMHRPDSIYRDSPAEHYQFPKQYFARAVGSIGDWILYLAPSKSSGLKGYFAIARVQDIVPDPTSRDMFMAVIEPGSYLEFANPVAFNDASGPLERGLLNDSGRLSGRAQAAVRPVSASDFCRIVERGLDDPQPLLPRADQMEQPVGFSEDATPFEFDQSRDRVQQLTSRVVRDRVFRKIVLRAYDERCAITGLKLINGGGRAEVNAAHIRPVERNGPDSLHNGIALSGTAHWMFDRGLIGLSDELEILISRQVNDFDGVRAFINASGRATPPFREVDRPHPHFLRWHRDNCFKG